MVEPKDGVQGYDPDFLSVEVPVPVPGETISPDVLVWEGGTVLPYRHFSLVMSVSRRMAHWVAWNIDGGALKKLSRVDMDFTKDPRIPADTQVGNDLYEGNRLDRGHLARRADLTWGTRRRRNKGTLIPFTTRTSPRRWMTSTSPASRVCGDGWRTPSMKMSESMTCAPASWPGRSSVTMTKRTGVWDCRGSTGRSWPFAGTVSSMSGRSCSPKT